MGNDPDGCILPVINNIRKDQAGGDQDNQVPLPEDMEQSPEGTMKRNRIDGYVTVQGDTWDL